MNPAISMIRVGRGRDVFQVPREIWTQTSLVKIMPDGEGTTVTTTEGADGWMVREGRPDPHRGGESQVQQMEPCRQVVLEPSLPSWGQSACEGRQRCFSKHSKHHGDAGHVHRT